MPYIRNHEPTGQQSLALGANAADVHLVTETINALARRLPRGVVVEVVEAAMAVWLTGAFGLRDDEPLSTTLLTDGEVATTLLAAEGLDVVA